VPTVITTENLYYLLSHARDHFREGDEIEVSSQNCPDPANLLAKVLGAGIKRVARSKRAA
jgi:hypothetical protein